MPIGNRISSSAKTDVTFDGLKIALVHDWLTRRGGAERVLLEMHKIWPEAPIYTSAYVPTAFPEFQQADVRPTWLNKMPLVRRKHQLFPVLLAWAFRSVDLSDYDIVISSCSAQSKYVRTGPKTLHICYCYTPIRYYWSDYEWYLQHPPFGRLNWAIQPLIKLLVPPMRRLDFKYSQEVDVYVTQSRYIQDRIRRYYKRDSHLVHPPVDVERFMRTQKHEGGYYLIVGRQVAYKRLDLAIDAFNQLGLPLVVAGTGEEIVRQKPRAKANIDFRGFVPEADLPQLYADAKAFLHPQEEDFGLVPVEAMAAGTPVIAFGKGGAAETVLDGETGVLFMEQTPGAIIEAVKRLDTLKLEPETIKKHAEMYGEARFHRELKAVVDSEWARLQDGNSRISTIHQA